MKTITIISKKFGTKEVFVDDEDYDNISQFKWNLIKPGNTFYAISSFSFNKKRTYIYMHRVILKLTNQKEVCDHKDHNGLNNQKNNIRKATRSENQKNVKGRGVSNYLGVSIETQNNFRFRKKTQEIKKYTYTYWRAQIKIDTKQKRLGVFETEIDAAKAYDEAAKIHHKEFANLNFKE